uniref:Aquaporin 15-2 n=1 Tax=Cyprinus carpio TaxID=7962 RepID=A0A1B4ZD99_CYPCA|nr:aquaporin 15-2 [Cyprinus carpio]
MGIKSKRERKEEKIVCQVAPGVYLYQALLVEMAVTFQLVLCVQAASQPKSVFSSVAPAVICLSVTHGHIMAVYWVGLCSGFLLAWLLHDLVLHPRWRLVDRMCTGWDFVLAFFLPGYCMTWCSILVGDWLTECKEAFLKDLSKQFRGSENHMEA